MSNKKWDVLVTCHKLYLQWLPQVLRAWNEQCPGKKVLTLDDCPSCELPEGCSDWVVIHGKWGHPSPARNVAWKALENDFFFCWDADNEVPPDMGKLVENILSNDDGKTGFYGTYLNEDAKSFPGSEETTYGGGLDTNSLWKREAVCVAGGWRVMRLEDIDLGLRIESLGWALKNFDKASGFKPSAGERIRTYHRRSHPNQRGREVNHWEKWWQGRSMTVVTTQRTDKMFLKWWEEGFTKQEYPDKNLMSLVIGLDEHHSSSGLREAVMNKVAGLDWKSVTVIDSKVEGVSSVVNGPKSEVGYKYLRSIGNIVSCINRIDPSSQVILTWDDDTLPENPTALRQLSDSLRAIGGDEVGCVSGWYTQRYNADNIVAGRCKSSWGNPIKVSEVKEHKGLLEVGMVGNGFALWRGNLIRAMNGLDFVNNKATGWDFCACKFLGSKGKKILVHSEVFCEHDFSLNPDKNT